MLKWCASNTLKKLRSLTPEDYASENIDHQLESFDWVVHNMSNMAVMSVSLRKFQSTNKGPEVKKRTGANTSPNRERVNQQIVSGRALAAGSSHWGYRRLAPCRSQVVHPDLASTLGAKISRLAGNRSEAWHNDVEKQTDGQPVSKLISTLFDSVDADKNRDLATSKFSVSAEEVTEAQLDEIEAEQVGAPLFPFHNPRKIKHKVTG